MARSLFIEEEWGVTTGRIHPHNGYYAGDFSQTPVRTRPTTPTQPLQKENR